MASTTKIMTCILVLENSRLDEAAEVSAYAASMPKVRLGVQPKERYLTGDLLYSLMLEVTTIRPWCWLNMWQAVWRHLQLL